MVDVDFPTVALSEAWWDAGAQMLFVTPEPLNDEAAGEPTTFRVENLPEPGRWTVSVEGDGTAETRAVGDSLEVRTTSAPRRHRVHR